MQTKMLNIFERDLILEMAIDLLSIYVGLYSLKLIGLLFAPQLGWMALWNWIIELFGEDPYKMYVIGNLLVLLVFYWLPATLYTIIDVFQPKLLYQYKVQKEKSQVYLSFSTLSGVVAKVLGNQVFQTLIGSEIAWRHRYRYINMESPLTEVPSLNQ